MPQWDAGRDADDPARALRCFVADADLCDRVLLRGLLEREGGALVVGQSVDGSSLTRSVERAGVDVLFVDARLPGWSRAPIATARGLPVTVVTSGLAGDAAFAFSIGATDFLAKPCVSIAPLRALLGRVRARLEELRLLAALRGGQVVESAEGADGNASSAVGVGRSDADVRRAPIPIATGTAYVAPSTVEHVRFHDCESLIFTTDGLLRTRMSLPALMDRLGPAQLFRVHRSALVSLPSARELYRSASGQMCLRVASGASIPVAKRRLSALRSALSRAAGHAVLPNESRRDDGAWPAWRGSTRHSRSA